MGGPFYGFGASQKRRYNAPSYAMRQFSEAAIMGHRYRNYSTAMTV
jgi:hypothetical protein